ncbi:MAG: hypothetical protein ACYDCO_03950 [Armatimonadota bacterium]
MKKLLILGMIATLACSAFAYPTLAGPTGLVTVPDAAVASTGQFLVAADYYNTDPDSTIPVRFVYGVGENFEVGALYAIQSDASAWGVNAKYRLPFALGPAGLAVGAQYFTSDDLEETAMQLYAVGTLALMEATDTTPAFNGSLGVNWTSDEVDVPLIGYDEDAIRIFAGVEAVFANNLRIVAEYQTENEDFELDSTWSVAARYPFTNALTAQIGMTNTFGPIPLFGIDDRNLFAGVSYAFGAADDDDF